MAALACCLLPSVCPPLCGLCGCATRCCPSCERLPPRPGRWRTSFFTAFALSVVLSWLLRDFYASRLRWFPALRACATDACLGKQAVLRVSLGTCLFFGALAVLTVGVRRPSSRRGRLHTRWLGSLSVAVPVWLALVFAAFYPSNAVLGAYFEAARAGGALFLLLQLVTLLDYVYATNESCLERDDAPSRATLVAGALAGNAAAVAGSVLLFLFWAAGQPRATAFVAAQTGLYGLVTLVSLLPSNSGGIFTSGAVSAYGMYLCATAIQSDPLHPGASPRWLQVLGFLIALLTLMYSTFSASGTVGAFELEAQGVAAAPAEETPWEEPEEVHPLSYAFFHAMFSLGAMYAAMLFTGWTAAAAQAEWALDKGVASMWVKIGCSWACSLLYLWMLLAPLLCRGRDFGKHG